MTPTIVIRMDGCLRVSFETLAKVTDDLFCGRIICMIN